MIEPGRTASAHSANAMWFRNNWPGVAMFGVWCAVVLLGLSAHEPWRDEADTWLAARDLSPIGLWKLARFSGSPLLAYALYSPAAQLGLPYVFLKVTHFLFAAGVVWLIFFRSPLTRTTQFFVCFSHLFMYEYAVVSRCYAPTNLFIFLTVAAHRSNARFAKQAQALALIVAANITVFGAIFACGWAGICALDRSQTRARRVWGLIGAMGGLALFLMQLLPRPADGFILPRKAAWEALEQVGLGLAAPWGEWWLRAIIGVLAILGAGVFLRRRPLIALGWVAMSAAVVGFSVFVRIGFVRHWGFVIVFFVALLWVAQEPQIDETSSKLKHHSRWRLSQYYYLFLIPYAVIWVFGGINTLALDVMRPFSNAAAAARFLVDTGLQNRPLAAWSSSASQAVLPYLAAQSIYYPSEDRVGSYMLWNGDLRRGRRVKTSTVLERVHARWPQGGAVLISNVDIANPSTAGLAPLASFPEAPLFDDRERFFIFEVLEQGNQPKTVDADTADNAADAP